LDEFEKVWDKRRQVRVDVVKEAKKQNKNVYDYLWRSFPKPGDPNYTKLKEKEVSRHLKYKYDLFEPEAVCITEERFGGRPERYYSFGDGPKFVCGIDYLRESYAGRRGEDNCLVYSIGSNNQIQFEVSSKEQIGCEIHTFDPTLKVPFVGGAYATFHPWGLGRDGAKVEAFDSSFTTKSLQTMMRELGHTNRKIDIFKIDCEGCEFQAMPPVFDAIAAGTLRIDQILIEMHNPGRDGLDPYVVLADFFAAADRAGFRITHKERNHWGCNGYGCLEYVFVSEDFLRRATAAAIC
jgi:hypothetical protein